jgi:hypothetical protein
MTTTDVISPDLTTVLRRLKLSRMLDTLPERLTLARQQKMPHQDLLLQVLSDEVARRDSLAVTLRVQHARLDPTMRLEQWDTTAKVTFDRALLNELATLRFLDAHAHVTSSPWRKWTRLRQSVVREGEKWSRDNFPRENWLRKIIPTPFFESS